MIELGYFGNF